MKILGGMLGATIAFGIVLGLDFQSGPGAFLLGFGCSGLGVLIGAGRND